MSRAVHLLAAAVLLASTGAATAQTPMAFDRPGIGFGSTVLAPGEAAWEQGLPDVERDDSDGERTTTLSANSVLRVGLGASLELQLAGAPRVHETVRTGDSRTRVRGAGDSSVGLKWALPVAGDLDWALLAQYGLATGSAGLRPQTHARRLAASVAGDTAGGRGFALFAAYSHQDDGRGWMVSPSVTLFESDTVSTYAEAGFGSGAEAGVSAGGGLTWQPRDALQFDVSVLRGLDNDAADWTGGVGFSVGFR